MSKKPQENAIAANRILAGFGLIVAVGIWLAFPGGSAVRRELPLKIDPNIAPSQVLDALPSLGPVKVNYRVIS